MQTDDLQDLLIIEQMNSFSPWTSSQFTEAHNYIYVLLCESVVIGFVALIQSYDQAELQNFSIHRDYQNLGYGKRLLDFAFQHLSRDVKTIFLYLYFIFRRNPQNAEKVIQCHEYSM